MPHAPTGPNAAPARPWDIFCRVIDNHGDLGVCWRLARGLADSGLAVRLWVDDASALAWMAPSGHPGVELLRWADPLPDRQPGAVVIEAFGCDPPESFVRRMAAMAPPPVWLNLEYLSAQAYVERSHGLPSPQSAGPGRGLRKWFFFPGFTAATGGLMHGDGCAAAAPSDRRAWAAALGLALPPAALQGDERLVLVFAYPHAPWADWLAALAAQGPTRLLVPPGPVQQAIGSLLGPAPSAAATPSPPTPTRPAWQAIAPLPQPAFDTLLAGCDLNIVRGEDSVVRAQLASDAPWLWHIYRQDDGAHADKLNALLAQHLAQAPPLLRDAVLALQHSLNGLAPLPSHWPAPAAWRAHQQRWRVALRTQTDLVSRLRAFVAQRLDAAPG